VSAGGLVPAARSPREGRVTMYESLHARRAGSETPVFDKLLVEYREGFRTIPGEAWAPHPAPRFAELGTVSERFQLPPGRPTL
jgi:hypothetical protein